MEKIILVLFLAINSLAFSQSCYKKINEKKVNQERLNVGKEFGETFLKKCQSKDYSTIKNFTLSKKIERKLNDSIQQACNLIDNNYGKVTIQNLNSSYFGKCSKNVDPIDLFVFDVETEKKTEIKYMNVWVYEDKNIIGGLWFSKEKATKHKRKK